MHGNGLWRKRRCCLLVCRVCERHDALSSPPSARMREEEARSRGASVGRMSSTIPYFIDCSTRQSANLYIYIFQHSWAGAQCRRLTFSRIGWSAARSRSLYDTSRVVTLESHRLVTIHNQHLQPILANFSNTQIINCNDVGTRRATRPDRGRHWQVLA